MDLPDDYEKKLEQYKTAELSVEEYDIEIKYLKAKLEGLNKYNFHINKSIKYYEKQYEAAVMQSIEIDWKQNKANTLLLSIKQYETQLEQIKFDKEPAEVESNKLENLKKEIDILERKCSENTAIIKQLNEELSEMTEECAIKKYKI